MEPQKRVGDAWEVPSELQKALLEPLESLEAAFGASAYASGRLGGDLGRFLGAPGGTPEASGAASGTSWEAIWEHFRASGRRWETKRRKCRIRYTSQAKTLVLRSERLRKRPQSALESLPERLRACPSAVELPRRLRGVAIQRDPTGAWITPERKVYLSGFEWIRSP